MMPNIEIPNELFQRLQKVAVPFLDTPATVIEKLLNHYEGSDAKEDDSATSEVMHFSATNIPALRHTNLVSATFDGSKPEAMNWNSLVRLALSKGLSTFVNVDALRRASQARIVDGIKDDNGYRPVANLDFSFQGVSADDAARIITRLAKALKVEAQFEWEWREKDDAYAPGKFGRVAIAKNQSKVEEEA